MIRLFVLEHRAFGILSVKLLVLPSLGICIAGTPTTKLVVFSMLVLSSVIFRRAQNTSLMPTGVNYGETEQRTMFLDRDEFLGWVAFLDNRNLCISPIQYFEFARAALTHNEED